MLRESPRVTLRGAAGDLSTAEGVERVSSAIPDVDILVNNLGAFAAKPFFDLADEEWEHMWQVNVMSGVRVTRRYMRGMLDRNWGRVIFISSEAALNPSGGALHYGATKTAVLGLSRGLAELTVGTGVTVNAVLPGPTRTEANTEWMTGVAAEKGISLADAERDYFANDRPASLIRRFAEASEVAAVVAFLASPRGAITNGAAVRAEGGVIHSIG
jgi:NAD(P)-dependent dehydrogenase (short-subunit alcohol dehydrogenase family)